MVHAAYTIVSPLTLRVISPDGILVTAVLTGASLFVSGTVSALEVITSLGFSVVLMQLDKLEDVEEDDERKEVLVAECGDRGDSGETVA